MPESGDRRPNILFIMSDDHAANAMSCYGSRINETPHMDRIAAEGMRLDNCFCTNSICTPSRATILTGQYSHVNEVYTLADELDGTRDNVAKMLQRAGYQTAVIGKWHLRSHPTGYDYWIVLPGQGLYHDPLFIEMDKGERTIAGYATDLVTDMSIDWLRNRDEDRPFFLLCHHKAPHRPWEPDEKHATMYDGIDIPEPDSLFDDYQNRSQAAANAKLRIGENMHEGDLKREIPPDLKGNELRRWAYQYYIKDYLRCVASVDDNVGRMLDYLDEERLADNTVVIYTSDQGFFLGEHGYYDKRFMYEESLQMPFVVRYPAEIEPGAVNDDIVVNNDFAPLFLDYAGVDVPPQMQARSFRRVLCGDTPDDWQTSLYYRYWMHLSHHGVPAHYGVRTKQYKLIYYYGEPLGKSGAVDQPTQPEWELFDLVKDPCEMNNVYDDPAYADAVRELKAELNRLKDAVGDTE
jgi:arylsulfatase A-like enzyme